MRTVIIPAQITTVEDRIISTLTVKQIILLIMPIFFSAIDIMLLPPLTEITFYKLVLMMIVAAIFIILAIRINSRLIIEWLLILINYNFRPRLYIFDINSCYLRNNINTNSLRDKDSEESSKQLEPSTNNKQSRYQEVYLFNGLSEENNINFITNKKGSLSVYIEKK